MAGIGAQNDVPLAVMNENGPGKRGGDSENSNDNCSPSIKIFSGNEKSEDRKSNTFPKPITAAFIRLQLATELQDDIKMKFEIRGPDGLLHGPAKWTQDEINLDGIKCVTEIVTIRSEENADNSKITFTIQYKKQSDGEWSDIYDIKVFSGNGKGKKSNTFPKPITAASIRLQPVTKSRDDINMKFEIRGRNGLLYESKQLQRLPLDVELDGDRCVTEIVTYDEENANNATIEYTVQYKDQRGEWCDIYNDKRYTFGEFTYRPDGKRNKDGYERERHKFVKVDNSDGKLDVQELVQKITDEWKLSRPNLVISVTGGTWDFPMNRHVREVFRKGIVEAAESTDAVIITGGTNAGVMKYTGTAMKDFKTATGKGEKVVTLGIATWDKLRNDIKTDLSDALEGQKVYTFTGNGKDEATKRNTFPKPIQAASIRLQPDTKSDGNIKIKFEIRGQGRNEGILHEYNGPKSDPIEVPLSCSKCVTEIVTFGEKNADYSMLTYKVQYKEQQNREWRDINTAELNRQVPDEEPENGTLEPNHSHFILIYSGKNDWGADVPVRAEFEKQIKAMHVRKLGMQVKKITCSSTDHEKCNHSKARLNGSVAWTPQPCDDEHWLEVDLDGTKVVSRVLTQGHPTADKWVTTYKIQYKVGKEDEWSDAYVKGAKGNTKTVFTGNSGRTDVKSNKLSTPVRAAFVRLVPLEWNKHDKGVGIGMRFALKGFDDMEIQGTNCSSPKHEDCNHSHAGLTATESAWTPTSDKDHHWLDVNLGVTKVVSKVVTRGHPTADKWVTKYKVQYKVGKEDPWTDVKDGLKVKEFDGNCDRVTVKSNKLPEPIQASFIRLLPTKWSTNGIGMRFALRGNIKSLCLTDEIHDDQITCSDEHDKEKTSSHTQARLNGESAWIPNPCIEVDLGVTKLVSEVLTQGHPTKDRWVEQYQVQYKVGQKDKWHAITDEELKEFKGNSDNASIQTNELTEPVQASFIRLIPTYWSTDGIGMRFEIQGPNDKKLHGTCTCSSPQHEACNHSKAGLDATTSAWTPQSSDHKHWLDVDLGGTKDVSKVLIRGHPTEDKWVTQYKMQYKEREDGDWMDVKCVKEFDGNCDRVTVKSNKLPEPIQASFIRLLPTKWSTNGIGMRFALRGNINSLCLTDEIHDDQITCSDEHDKEKTSSHTQARLNGESAWIPNPCIEVDLGVTKLVSEVLTQGHPTKDRWVEQYQVQYKVGQKDKWHAITDEEIKEFKGNSDNASIQTNELTEPVQASFIRLIPTDWSKGGIGMQFEIKGPNDTKLHGTCTCSSPQHEACNHSKAGLDATTSAWTPQSSDHKHWLDVDLGGTKDVSKVLIRGHPTEDKWVTQFKIQYKEREDGDWMDVKCVKEFEGNSDRDTIKYTKLPEPIRASFIRLRPTKWSGGGIGMRFELKGCDDLPVVCLLVEGGQNSIQQPCEAVEKGTPVVVVDNSGRASDVLAFAFQQGKQMTEEKVKQKLANILSKEKAAEGLRHIKQAIERSDLLNVYDAKSSIDIDQAILQALMTANKTNIGLQMTLAQTWNRIDIVKDGIFGSIAETTDWERYKREEETISNNFRKALINDQAGFVKIFLENGVVDLDKFLTKAELQRLYMEAESDRLMEVITKLWSLPMSRSVKKLRHLQLIKISAALFGLFSWITCKKWCDEEISADEDVILTRVVERLRKLTSLHFKEYSEEKALDPSEEPLRHLFIFALLNDYVKMAEYFWEEGNEHIAGALVASKIYRSRAEHAKSFKEVKDRYLRNEKKYDKLACKVLDECEEQNEEHEESESPDILLRKLNNWGGKSCLDLAEISDNKRFIASSAVQSLLEDIWCHGKGFVDKEIIPSEFSRSIWKRFFNVLFSRFRMTNGLYSSSPEAKFWNSVTFYLLFLALFTYVMVSDQLSNRWPEGWEALLIAWGITFIAEEIRQLLVSPFSLPEMRESVKLYFSSIWNWIDICMLGTFFIGFILRLADASGAARIFLAISVFAFYIRLLHKLTKFKHTGPKVLMIRHMMIDLLVFMVILLIVLIGYGVTVKAVLYPHVTDHFVIFREIMYRPYFQIYGELFLEDIHATGEEGDCSTNVEAMRLGATPCPENSSWGLLFLALYMIFSNVLLLNLLIAMFSHTFDKVQDENDIHWKFLRYSLTKEYYNRPVLAPPLIFLSHLSRMTRCCVGWCMKNVLDRAEEEISERVMWKPEVMVRTLSDEDTARIMKMEQRYAYGNILSKRRKEREKKSLQTQMTEVECKFTSLQNQLTELKGGFTDLQKKFDERKSSNDSNEAAGN